METKKCEYCGSNMKTHCGWFTVDIMEFDGSSIGSEERFCVSVYCSNDSCSTNDLPF